MIRARSESPPNSGTLTVAAAPTGEPADVTARLRAELAAASLIAVADPEWLRQHASALGVALTGRVVSTADNPTIDWVPDLLAELRAARDVLLITDLGSADAEDPGSADAGDRGAGDASDPGRDLIAAAAAAGIRVTVLPGPSPITAALAVAGLPAERFVVEGSMPPGAAARDRRLAELAGERRTLIFTESRGRLGQTLAALASAFGADRLAAVCSAPPTDGQAAQRGTLGDLAKRLTGRPPCDVTLVVAGAPVPDASAAAVAEPDVLADAVAQVLAQVRDGETTRDAVAAVAARTGLRRRDLYNAASRSRAAGTPPAAPGDPAS